MADDILSMMISTGASSAMRKAGADILAASSPADDFHDVAERVYQAMKVAKAEDLLRSLSPRPPSAFAVPLAKNFPS